MSRSDPKDPAIVITGASSGIGRALALQLAREPERLVLSGRNRLALDEVASGVVAAGGQAPLVVVADLADPVSVEALATAVADAGLSVRHLVNNAGFGLSGDVSGLPLDGQTAILDVNCRALTALTARFLDEILAGRGGVLNVASVAAFTPGPGFAVYYASKAYVLSLTLALREELKGKGVLVSALCPGPTPTAFGRRAGFGGTRAIRLLAPLSAEAVAAIGWRGYRAGKAIVVPGLMNQLAVTLLPLVPRRLVLPLIARAQRKRRTGTPDPPR